MKRLLIATLLACLALAARAGPVLTADPYPAGDAQPTSASVAITSAPNNVTVTTVPCSMAVVTGGLQPRCDLSSLVVPGVYTLVLTVSTLVGCTGGPAAFTCESGGTASTTPFTLTLRASPAGKPVPRLSP